MSKIKIIIAILVSVAVLAGAGVGIYFGFFAEDEDEGKKVSVSDKDDKDGKEDEKDTEDAEKEEKTTAQVITKPSKEDLVFDSEIKILPYGSATFCYHIPAINYHTDEIDWFNKKIADQFKELADEQIQKEKDTGVMEYGNISYVYGVKEDTVSILVRKTGAEFHLIHFDAYNVDLKTGNELTDEEVLSLMGVSQEDFRESVKNAVQLYTDNALGDDDGEMYKLDIEFTLSDEAVAQARPFIDIDGRLKAVTYVFSFGGAGRYLELLDLESGEIYEFSYCDDSHLDVVYKDLPENERDAAVLYTEYLRNKGHSKFTSCEHNIYYYYNISSCFADLFGDDTPELFIEYNKKEYNYDVSGAFYADALLTIKDGKVEVVNRSENWGGSGGGAEMKVVYDKLYNCPAVYRDVLSRAGYAYNMRELSVYSRDYDTSTQPDKYERFYIYIEEYTQEEIDKVKGETDVWVENTDESSFEYYMHNGEYITEGEYNRFIERFDFENIPSEYEMKAVTEFVPVTAE